MARGKSEGPISKRKMVEMAVGELGDVGPKELHAHIHKQHGVDISLQMISSYKSNLKKTGSTTGNVKIVVADGTIGLKDLSILTDLINRVGAAQLQSLIKMLNK